MAGKRLMQVCQLRLLAMYGCGTVRNQRTQSPHDETNAFLVHSSRIPEYGVFVVHFVVHLIDAL